MRILPWVPALETRSFFLEAKKDHISPTHSFLTAVLHNFKITLESPLSFSPRSQHHVSNHGPDTRAQVQASALTVQPHYL